jgi:hypothetical protein
MPAARRGRAGGVITTPCLRAVARTSSVERPMMREEAAGVRASDTQAMGRHGGDEDGGATVHSRR